MYEIIITRKKGNLINNIQVLVTSTELPRNAKLTINEY